MAMSGKGGGKWPPHSRRDFFKHIGAGTVAATLGGTLSGTAQGAAAGGGTGPNIVLIMADDLGVETLGCYGGESYPTPNLDALAAEGTMFDHCYSNPVCTPSRVNLLTGRYGFRTGSAWGHIPPDEITFGHMLQRAGYATGVAGKWQLSLLKDDPEHVHRMGFDAYACWAWHEGPRYWNPMVWQNGRLRHEEIAHRYGPDVFV